MKTYIIGNWKMNGSSAANQEWFSAVKSKELLADNTVVALCVPFPYLAICQAELKGGFVSWGAQNLSPFSEGAYTGEVSAKMIIEFGCQFVIVGHSERRVLFAEDDKVVAEKALAALAVGLTPIVCVGENLAEREAGQAQMVVDRQLMAVVDHIGIAPFVDGKVIVAYEPIWAIGTGKTASPDAAEAMHVNIFDRLCQLDSNAAKTPILYGGSMNPSNAKELLLQPHINGGLIGGASLKVDSFLAIVNAQ